MTSCDVTPYVIMLVSLFGKNTDKEGTTREGRQRSGVFIRMNEPSFLLFSVNALCRPGSVSQVRPDLWSDRTHTTLGGRIPQSNGSDRSTSGLLPSCVPAPYANIQVKHGLPSDGLDHITDIIIYQM